MKLSDAIRLGAMLKPQIFRHVFRDGGTCALGAAMDAVGLLFNSEGPAAALALWPFLTALTGIRCPACELNCRAFDSAITHLNDYHGWTRERIADWVETIESSQSVDAVREETDQPVVAPRV